MNESDLARCGVAARRLLDFYWRHPPLAVTRLAIEAVVATAHTEPTETERLLRRAIEPDRLESHGANDLHCLCDSVPSLAVLLPAFVEDLYVAVMEFEERSTDATQLVGSAILPLTSTRRQDVEMAKWDLVRHYRK